MPRLVLALLVSLLAACAAPTRPDLPTWQDCSDALANAAEVPGTSAEHTCGPGGAAQPAAQPAGPQEPENHIRPSTERRHRLITGVGITADPSTFLLGMQYDRMTSRDLIIGPAFQLGTSDNETFFSLTFNLKKEYEVMGRGRRPAIFPYIQVGAGIAYLEKDDAPGDNDDFGLLVNTGGGVRVPLDDGLSVSSTLLFNFIPGEIVDERFILSWQIAQVQFLF